MKIQLAHTYDDIISVNNLLCAWEEFVVDKSSKPDVIIFAGKLMDNIFSLREDLVNRTYRHCQPKVIMSPHTKVEMSPLQ